MPNRGNKLGNFLLAIIVILLVGYAWYYLTHKTEINSGKTSGSATLGETSQKTAAEVADPATLGWNTDSNTEYGYSFKYPTYIKVAPATSLPKILASYDFGFSPNPNADFMIFSFGYTVNSAQNFVFPLPGQFIAYDPSTGKWYANTDPNDRPSASHPTYTNLYKPENVWNLKVYAKTTSDLTIHGPFTIGDKSRGSQSFLVPIKEKNIVLIFTFKYNNDALGGSTEAIKSLKAKFDNDLVHIMSSVTATE
jgi:hypothetical protein